MTHSEIPDGFRWCLSSLEGEGYALLSYGWTNDHLKRHVGAVMERNGQKAFVKLAIANKPDLDEKDMRVGFERELWWSQVIQRLREHDPAFPFTSPKVLQHNLDGDHEIVYVVLEFIEGKPIVEWEPEAVSREVTAEEEASFNELLDVVVATAHALNAVHPATLQNLGLPDLPSPPHGQRRTQKLGLLDMGTATLGNGAFEIKNFWRTASGQLVLMDNEFCGWYPSYDHLSYLFHRLYCNQMQPDLARRVMARYVERYVSGDERKPFFKQFRKLLMPRVIGGSILDMSPRRKKKFWPWHRKQLLRAWLLINLLLGRHKALQ